jgi:hypothetical protein
MSQQNVEIVLRSNALMNAGEIEAALRLVHPEIEWVVAKDHPEARTIVGREAVSEYRAEWQQMLPDVRFDADRWLDAGEQVVAIGSARGTGIDSGAQLQVPIAFVFTLRDGLISRVEEYIDPHDALDAAGLTE